MKTAIVVFSIIVCSYPTAMSRVLTTKANLRLLQNVVRQFEMETGRLPTASEGLNVLIAQPPDVLSWPDGGYLETTDIPKDGWGNDFVYFLDPNLPHGFGIYSCGQDGVTLSQGNDRDDLNTWDTQSPGSGYYSTRRVGHWWYLASAVIIPLIILMMVLMGRQGLARDRKSS